MVPILKRCDLYSIKTGELLQLYHDKITS